MTAGVALVLKNSPEAPEDGSQPHAEARILIFICSDNADTFIEPMPAI